MRSKNALWYPEWSNLELSDVAETGGDRAPSSRVVMAAEFSRPPPLEAWQ